MASPIVTPISSNPEDVFQDFVDYMQSQIPGWEPADGSALTFVAEGFAQITAQTREQANDVTTSIFRWYGANVAGVAPIDAVSATSTVTITAVDNAGYTIDAGYTVALTDSSGSKVAFQTTEDAVIPALSTSVAGIGVAAVEGGEAGNGLSGTVIQVDSLAYVDSVTLDDPTSGGSDAEDDEDYLIRLVAEEQLRSVAPILARDFAQLAKRVQEVNRVAYLDGYDTSDGSDGNALMVTLVPVQEDGSDVSTAGKAAIVAQFAEDGDTPALVGFVVNVADPHRTTIDVAFTATASEGYDPADVADNAEAAVADFLDPANWGLPQSGEERRFDVTETVRLGNLYRVLYDVDGLHDVSALTIEGAGADFTLPVTDGEPVGITEPGSIVGTVS